MIGKGDVPACLQLSSLLVPLLPSWQHQYDKDVKSKLAWPMQVRDFAFAEQLVTIGGAQDYELRLLPETHSMLMQ